MFSTEEKQTRDKQNILPRQIYSTSAPMHVLSIPREVRFFVVIRSGGPRACNTRCWITGTRCGAPMNNSVCEKHSPACLHWQGPNVLEPTRRRLYRGSHRISLGVLNLVTSLQLHPVGLRRS